MNSRKGGDESSFAAGGNNSSQKVRIPESGSGKVDQLVQAMADCSTDLGQEGEWEVKMGKKSKNRGGATATKPWLPANSVSRARGHSEGAQRQGWNYNGGGPRGPGSNMTQGVDSQKQVGKSNQKFQSQQRGWESAYMTPRAAIPPPLQNGWQWAARSGSSKTEPENVTNPQKGSTGGYNANPDAVSLEPDDGTDEDELVEDTDDDLSDDYDSDASQKSHETRKKNGWFKTFFEDLDKLTVEEMGEQTRQWHCPACHNGPGAIEWYKGLQPLMTHAKTKGAKRVKLHRELATLLEEELQRRGTSVIPAGEAYGQWKGLRETATDHEIVWPPMVVVMNTIFEKDSQDKWVGMGNQELVDYFSAYGPARARHSYGPHGHRGMSVLIFEPTAVAYLEAERLHKHFAEQGTDRDAWERRRVLFYPGGKRQLYGYLANKEDMEIFNKHCQGKSRLKYEMRSYQEMVVHPMKQMSEDNQQLIWFKNKFVRQEQRSKALKESFGVVSQKLRETMEENRIVRLRTKMQHEENKEEMDFQENFFKKQMDKIHRMTEEKEKEFEQLLQAERAKAKQSDTDSGTNEERKLRKEEIVRFINSQVKGVEEFEVEREKLICAHKEKKLELKRRHLAEEVELEQEFDSALTELMQTYTPSKFEAPSPSNS